MVPPQGRLDRRRAELYDCWVRRSSAIAGELDRVASVIKDNQTWRVISLPLFTMRRSFGELQTTSGARIRM